MAIVMPSPFIDLSSAIKMNWRDGDIVVNGGVRISMLLGNYYNSIQIKSGTHWVMNIVYQLLSGGDGDFEDLYEKVPWLDLVEYPGQQVRYI